MSTDTQTSERTQKFKVIDSTAQGRPPSRFEIDLPYKVTFSEALEALCKKLEYQTSHVKVTYPQHQKVVYEDTEPITERFVAATGSILIMLNAKDEFKTSFKGHEQENFRAPQHIVVGPQQTSHAIIPVSTATSSSSSSSTTSSSSYSWSNWNTKSDTGYVGLSNQGATCYLNSLLQALFMTPEFRRALYDWSWDDYSRRLFEEKLTKKKESQEKEKEKEGGKSESAPEEGDKSMSHEERYLKWKAKAEDTCIPLQLQKLFVGLQLSESRAMETTNLTKSFNWSSAEAFTQHDVQELCRVLFDALENVWKGTAQNNLINELYQGDMKDYVQCLECNYESSRTDKYLDIPLVIKGFGESEAVKSVQEALWKFVQRETLTGNNQYACERCNKKVDAYKGLKFTKFPYLLMLQLKRFDFDFTYMRRVKLNDRVSFPEILNMNQFLNADEPRKGTQQDGAEKENEGEATPMETDGEAKPEDGQNDTDSRQRALQRALQSGPYVYELYGVLIHRGSALGGHYYAYIRSFREGKWMEFNDSSVSAIPDDRYKETFGESSKSGSMYSSGTNAYMLLYRQYDPQRSTFEPSKEELSEKMQQLFTDDQKQEEEKKQERERQRKMVTFKVVYQDQTKSFEHHQDSKLGKISEEICAAFGIAHLWPKNARLRDWLSHYDVPGKSYSQEQMEKSCSELSMYYQKLMWIETKEDHEEFEKHEAADNCLKAFIYDKPTGKWSSIQYIHSGSGTRVHHLKETLSKKLNVPADSLVVSRAESEKPVVLQPDDELLSTLRIWEGSKIWVEPKYTEEEIKQLTEQLQAQQQQQAATSTDQPQPAEANSAASAIEIPLRCATEIFRLHNSTEASFVDPFTKKSFKLVLSKKDTIGDLRKALAEKLGKDTEEFKLVKEWNKTELRDDDLEIDKIYLTSVVIEPGKPMRRGEFEIKWKLFQPNAVNTTEHLFKLALPSKMTIKEAKEELVKYFDEQQKNDATKRKTEPFSLGKPENLRIREVFMAAPSAIFPDATTIKDAVGSKAHYTSPELLIQMLPEGKSETKTNSDCVVLFMQRFYPDQFKLGPRFEFETNDNEKLGVLIARIKAETGIENLSLHSCDSWEEMKLMSIPDLKWTDVVEETAENRNTNTFTKLYYAPDRTVKTWRISDGDLYLFKDATAPLKQLTDEEKKAIVEEEEKRRKARVVARSYAPSSREESLVIKQKDVGIDD